MPQARGAAPAAGEGVATDSAGPAASEESLFPVLDGYWKGLQQGAAADLEQWLHSHPEDQDARPGPAAEPAAGWTPDERRAEGGAEQ